MPDIAMCTNKECHLRGNCYRFMAQADKYQSYDLFEPDGENCEWFIDLKKKLSENDRQWDTPF